MNWLINLKVNALAAIDTINGIAEPYRPFTRPTDLPPEGRGDLDQLAAHFESQTPVFTDSTGGTFLQTVPTDLGDAAVWQGVYTAMRVLARHAEPTEARAEQEAAAVRALYRYVQQGVILRGAIPGGMSATQWHVDPNWSRNFHLHGNQVLRDDASLDSLLGWCFGMATVLRYGPAGSSWANHPGTHSSLFRVEFQRFVERFMADGCRLRNIDGSWTRYGDCRPGVLQAPIRNLAAALVLKLAAYSGVMSNDRWRQIARDHGREFGRLETHFLWKRRWFNDHLAMLGALAYLMVDMPDDPARLHAVKGLHTMLTRHAEAGNAFLIFMAPLAGCVTHSGQIRVGRQVLSEFSTSDAAPNGKTANPKSALAEGTQTVKWGDERVTRQPIPIWRRAAADVHWQRNPYGTGVNYEPHLRYSGLDYLIAYWAMRNSP